MASLRYWIWLSSCRKLSAKSALLAYRYFGSPEEVFFADREAIDFVPGLTGREKDSLMQKDLRTADEILGNCDRLGISVMTYQDAQYPERLRNIDVPPLVLYYKGTFLPFDDLPVITVVGSRKCSSYGALMAKQLGSELALCGGVVVSGAAMGIDSLALEGALSAGGSVAAVLGNGIDVVYPASARNLYADVAAHGCLISEYAPGTPPYGENFPRRNRIMSGLGLGVLVVEAAKKSGSLITADYALEQGRDVFAVPGNAGQDSNSGSNGLIQEGAKLVTCGWDILQEYQARFPQRLQRKSAAKKLTLSPKDQRELASEQAASAKPTGMAEEKTIDNPDNSHYIDLKQILSGLSEDETKIVLAISEGEKHIDDIITETELTPARALASLTLLEVKRLVRQNVGKRFRLNIP